MFKLKNLFDYKGQLVEERYRLVLNDPERGEYLLSFGYVQLKGKIRRGVFVHSSLVWQEHCYTLSDQDIDSLINLFSKGDLKKYRLKGGLRFTSTDFTTIVVKNINSDHVTGCIQKGRDTFANFLLPSEARDKFVEFLKSQR